MENPNIKTTKDKNTKKTKDKNFSSWFYSCFFIPITIGLLVYFSFLLTKVDEPFHTSIGAGDLLSIAAMMLIAVHIEIKNIELPESSKTDDLSKDASLWIPMVLWVAYGIIKFVSLKYLPTLADANEKEGLINVVSSFSILCFLLAIAISFYCRKTFLERHEI